MKEYSCDYRLYTRKICIIRGKLKNFFKFLSLPRFNRLVLRLVEFQIFYKHIKVDNIDS